MDTQPLEHIKEMRNRRCVGGYNEKLITSIEEWLSAEEVRVKEVVENYAESHGVKLKVYDRAGFWGNLRARFKGVGTTPTVIIGKQRFAGDITEDMLRNSL